MDRLEDNKKNIYNYKDYYLKAGELENILNLQKESGILEKFDLALSRLTQFEPEKYKKLREFYTTVPSVQSVHPNETGRVIHIFSRYEEIVMIDISLGPVGERRGEKPEKIARNITRIIDLMTTEYLFWKECVELRNMLWELLPGSVYIETHNTEAIIDSSRNKNTIENRRFIKDIIDDYYGYNIRKRGHVFFEKRMCVKLNNAAISKLINPRFEDKIRKISNEWYFIMNHVLCYRLAERERIAELFGIANQDEYIKCGKCTNEENQKIVFGMNQFRSQNISSLVDVLKTEYKNDPIENVMRDNNGGAFVKRCISYINPLFLHPLKDVSEEDYEFIIAELMETLEEWNAERCTLAHDYIQIKKYLSYVDNIEKQDMGKIDIDEMINRAEIGNMNDEDKVKPAVELFIGPKSRN